MVAGYATFGDACQGNILLNYAPEDILSTLGRLATGMSLLFGFPLISNGAREGLKNAASALGWTSIARPDVHFRLVTTLLTITTSLALCVRDIQLVTGLTGAVMGSALVFICPPLLYSRIVLKTCGKNSLENKQASRNMLLIPFGCFTAAMGVAMTLRNKR
jgi:amino acid permease